ncbi:hypothetical protein [Pseudonocardia asaccharolytica]|uniref:hypothetical protein n=1 Tax=Pseudonocardia asaccharolytica TaxID=54010 RepID=UPI0004906FC9|nr:hypothetical protein [Pseudonocardia asaccharolytica]
MIALVALAANSGDPTMFTAELSRILQGAGRNETQAWLRGWTDCWARMIGERLTALDVDEIPGLPLMLRLSAGDDVGVPVPELRLHLESGALVIVFPGDSGRGLRIEAGGGTCPSVAGRWVIPRPVPVATCYDVFGNVHRVPVADPRNPLAFTGEGALIPPGHPLPADEIWLMHLGEPPVEAFAGPRHILEESVPPVGWPRWWLGCVSLNAVTAIRSAVDNGSGIQYGPWWSVAGAEHADLEFDDPINGILNRDGAAVYARPPRLRLPGGPGESWTIEVRDLDSPTPIRWTAPGDSVVTFDDLPHPIVGTFRLRAQAPGNRPVEGTFTVAEGLTCSPDPRIRLLRENGGLMPARVQIQGPRGLCPSPSVVRFGSEEIRRDVRLRVTGSETSLDLRVELPHCAIRKKLADETGAWEITAPTFGFDDLGARVCLDVRLPPEVLEAAGTVPDVVAGVTSDDEAGQRIAGHRIGRDLCRYRLGALIDTVRLIGTMTLWLRLPGMEAHVATVQGITLATAVRVDGGDLHVDGQSRRVRLRVTVRSPLAPWIAPMSAELDEGQHRLALEPPYSDGGPLSVTVSSAEPGWDRRRDLVFRCGEPGRIPHLGSPAERTMARYLAGVAPLPEVPDALSLLWIVAARIGAVAEPGLGALTAQECASRLGVTPEASLLAAENAGLTSTELIEPLIRSGLAAHRFRRVVSPDLIRRLWDSAPFPALLMTSPLLPFLAGSEDWDLTELDDDERRLLAAVRSCCDSSAIALLTGDAPGTRHADLLLTGGVQGEPVGEGGLDGSTPEPGEPTELWAEALARIQIFAGSSRYAPMFERLGHFPTAVPEPTPDALSLGCALVARIAAQGDAAAAAIERQTRHVWVEVAGRAPADAGNDLVFAEFRVSNWFAHHA